jgi:hypothetical protein
MSQTHENAAAESDTSPVIAKGIDDEPLAGNQLNYGSFMGWGIAILCVVYTAFCSSCPKQRGHHCAFDGQAAGRKGGAMRGKTRARSWLRAKLRRRPDTPVAPVQKVISPTKFSLCPPAPTSLSGVPGGLQMACQVDGKSAPSAKDGAKEPWFSMH